MARPGTENHGTENLGMARHGKCWHGKIRRALAQGVSDHRPFDSNKVQHPFFTGLNPNWTIFKAKINIEPQLLQLLLLLLLLLLKLLFLVQKRAREGGLSGSPGPWS